MNFTFLWQFASIFSVKSIFKQFSKDFSREKTQLYLDKLVGKVLGKSQFSQTHYFVELLYCIYQGILFSRTAVLYIPGYII